jgi:hypothetical protein
MLQEFASPTEASVYTSLSNSLSRLAVTIVVAGAMSLSAYAAAGTQNTTTADPPVPRPNTTPCIVKLFTNYRFADFNPKSFSYTPPICPAPWGKVVLVANFSITKGRQYDRTANIWIGGTNIYFGTTAEPSHDVARHWHIERDLTDYSAALTAAQAGTVDLGNLVNSTYTGVLYGSAQLEFYPSPNGVAPPVVPDQVIPFSAGPTGGTVALNTTTDLLQQTLTLPQNVAQVYFDVFAQSQSNDEFWYTCVPNDVANELFSCGGTSFRESLVTIDGTPAGVAPVYPWIYTGGIDPYLWRPIPGVQTLNFVPYRVNLTPFASMLDDGQPHTIALSVFNADSYFSATASLLLYLDHGSTKVTGAVTKNTLAAPNPQVVEKINTSKNGNIGGYISTKNLHNFQIGGYVNTSSGMVTTNLTQTANFSNFQVFKITSTIYQQNITQQTAIHATTSVRDPQNVTVRQENDSWPLTVNYLQVVASDGSAKVTTTIDQKYANDVSTRVNGQQVSFSLVSNEVTPTDTLDFDSSGNLIGNENQTSAQTYFGADSTGYCYSRSIQASQGYLVGIVNGVGCK